jgi:hypothetical protein
MFSLYKELSRLTLIGLPNKTTVWARQVQNGLEVILKLRD